MHKLLLHSCPLILATFYTAWMRKASLSFDPNWRQTMAGTDLSPRICEMTLNPVVLWTMFDLAECWHSVQPKTAVTFTMINHTVCSHFQRKQQQQQQNTVNKSKHQRLQYRDCSKFKQTLVKCSPVLLTFTRTDPGGILGTTEVFGVDAFWLFVCSLAETRLTESEQGDGEC